MLRKKVLGVGVSSTTLLVEDSASHDLKVLKRINISGWTDDEIFEADKMYALLGDTSIPVMVDVHSVAIQSSFLNVVTSYFPKGDLLAYVKNHNAPLSDAQIAHWVHVVALAVKSVHRLGFVHAGIAMDQIYLSEHRGAAGIVAGIPRPLPVYRHAMEASKQRAIATGGGGSNVSITTISAQQMELNFPPEVLESEDFHYDERSDIWHLGALLLALASSHQSLQRRPEALQQLVNQLCDDEPSRRPSIDEVLAQLKQLHVGAPTAGRDNRGAQGNQKVAPTIERLKAAAVVERQARQSVSPDPQDPLARGLAKVDWDTKAREQLQELVSIARLKNGSPAFPLDTEVAAPGRDDAPKLPTANRLGRALGKPEAPPAAAVTPRTHTPSAQIRSNSKPSSHRVANQAAHSAVVQMLHEEQMEHQRRKDEVQRELQLRKEKQQSEMRIMQEAQKQHTNNIKKIRSDTTHRDSIRKSIKQWQQQQNTVGERGEVVSMESGVAIFAKANAPQRGGDAPATPPRLAAVQTKRLDAVREQTRDVQPSHLTHTRRPSQAEMDMNGLEATSSSFADDDYYVEPAEGTPVQVRGSNWYETTEDTDSSVRSQKPQHRQPVALEITPPRRRDHLKAPAEPDSKVEFHNVDEQTDDFVSPVRRITKVQGGVVPPPLQQQQQEHADPNDLASTSSSQRAPAAAVVNDVAALAAMEWSIESLRRSIRAMLPQSGVWEEISSMIALYLKRPVVERLHPSATRAFFDMVDSFLIGNGVRDSALIALVMQLAAVEGTLALSQSLGRSA